MSNSLGWRPESRNVTKNGLESVLIVHFYTIAPHVFAHVGVNHQAPVYRCAFYSFL